MNLTEDEVMYLGANACEYSRTRKEQEEQTDFEWALKKIDLIVKTLQKLPNLERVADVGCRTGKEAAYYKEQAGIHEMHGFEISDIPLEVARKREIATHVWISGRSACPIADNFFDAVVAGDIIEHLLDTDVFLEELWRIIRPEGYLLIATPNLAWWWNRVRLLLGKVPGGLGSVSFKYAQDPAADTKHLRVSINSEWLYLFQQHGFDCVSVAGYDFPGLLREPLNSIDLWLSRYPSLANSNLFLLKKSDFKLKRNL